MVDDADPRVSVTAEARQKQDRPETINGHLASVTNSTGIRATRSQMGNDTAHFWSGLHSGRQEGRNVLGTHRAINNANRRTLSNLVCRHAGSGELRHDDSPVRGCPPKALLLDSSDQLIRAEGPLAGGNQHSHLACPKREPKHRDRQVATANGQSSTCSWPMPGLANPESVDRPRRALAYLVVHTTNRPGAFKAPTRSAGRISVLTVGTV